MISTNDIFLLLSFTLLFSTFLTFLSISDDFVITVDFNGIKRHHVLTAEQPLYNTDVPLLRLQKSDSSYDEYDSLLYLILGLTITLYYTSYHTHTTVTKIREFLSKNISVLYDISATSSHITSQRTIQLQNSKKTRVLLLSFLILFLSSIAFFEPTFNLSEAYAQVAPISISDSVDTFTHISDPSPVSTILDNATLALSGAFDITTVVINGTIYALVASELDSGVQIINITNPLLPNATAAIFNGEDYSLDSASGITTVVINNNTYALVASLFGHGVQIINITNPLLPNATAAITDGVNNFDTLRGANGITTVTISDNTYALVASFFDDGVQIINITDPTNPRPTASITDGVGNFEELDGANSITTVVIGDNTYALVASEVDDGVQIIDITVPSQPVAISNITDGVGDFEELRGAYGITTAVINNNTYALVASQFDDGVQIIDITNPAIPVATASITDNTDLELDGARGITTVTIGVKTFALVASQFDDGVQIIDITNPANPLPVSSITDIDTSTALDGANEITTITIDAKTYALVTSINESGVQIIDIGISLQPYPFDSAVLTQSILSFDSLSITDTDTVVSYLPILSLDSLSITDTITSISQLSFTSSDSVDTFTFITDPSPVSAILDNDTLALGGAFGITTVIIGNNTYALVASELDSGVQIINITNPLLPNATAAIFDGEDYSLDSASGITTVVINNNTYALVASLFGHGVQIINITNPLLPNATAAITDGANNFDTLRGANGITTVTISDNTYALVASFFDDGVQIINITDPTNPRPTASITDGVGNFEELDGANSITTVVIGDNTYALVASEVDDGVQIIDITVPSQPVAISNITDGVGDFEELRGAYGITTAVINNNTYALVASQFDDGVQIIDITNPAIPVATASITDNTDLELDGARGITTVTIGVKTFALVASQFDDGVQIIDITNPANPLPVSSITDIDTSTALDGANEITTITIDAKTYALVTSINESGVQIIDIGISLQPYPFDSAVLTQSILSFDSLSITDTDTVVSYLPILSLDSLSITDTITSINQLSFTSSDSVDTFTFITDPSPVSAILDNDTLALGGAFGITTVIIGNNTYALVTSLSDDGVQIIDITDPTMSNATAAIFDNATLALDNALGITTVVINNNTYALVAAQRDNGVQIIDITDPTDPVATYSITDGVGNFEELRGAYGITTTVINNNTYALVVSFFDDGVQIIDITDPTDPVATYSITDGVGNFEELDGANSITTTVINNNTYALVASVIDDGVQIIDITNPLLPNATASITDGVGNFEELRGAYGITTVVIGDNTYALVASQFDDGVQIIDITNPAIPVATASITDNTDLELDGARGITTVTIGVKTFALVASQFDDGVQIIDITNPANPLPVSSITDIDTSTALDGANEITTITIDAKTYALVTSINESGVQIIDIGISLQPYPFDSAVLTQSILSFDSLSITDSITDMRQYNISPSDSLSVTDSITGMSQLHPSDSLSVTDAVTAMSQLSVTTSDSVDTFTHISDPTSASSITDVTTTSARDITTITVGANTYALVASFGNNGGIQSINITDPTDPRLTDNLTDAGSLELGGAIGITTVTINDKIYALVASLGDDGVQIVNVTDPTNLTSVAHITDGLDFPELNGAISITTQVINDNTYALVAARDDNGIQIINITDPTIPTQAAVVMDDSSLALGGVFDITTVTINNKIYALAASRTDDGVQIIDITDPTKPRTVFTITDNGDRALNGARGITTTVISERTYALVASQDDNGVQIIDITNPATPVSIADIYDGEDFTELFGASDITAVTIGTSTFALVAAGGDNGVQIIDITNPTDPRPVSAITDGENNFETLAGANGITTVTIGDNTYALVASINDNGVQIIDIGITIQPYPFDSAVFDRSVPAFDSLSITDSLIIVDTIPTSDSLSITDAVTILSQRSVTSSDSVDPLVIITAPTPASSITDNSTLALTSSRDITTVTINDTLYALVTSLGNDGVQIIDISDPANPVATSNIVDNGTSTALDGAIGITTVTINDDTFALVASILNNGVQIINITDPTTPVATAAIIDGTGGFETLRRAISISTITINDDIYAIVAARDDNGIQIINITDPVHPSFTASRTDGANRLETLGGAFDITTVTINDTPYALVAARTDQGVQIIDLTNPAAPSFTATIIDNANRALQGPRGITTVSIGESTYALVVSQTSNDVQIINITNPTSPHPFVPIYDGTDYPELLTPSDITAVSIGANTYALVASGGDDGVQIIDITDPANPEPVSSITDGVDDFETLNGANGITTVTINDTIYALVASIDDNGIQIIDTGITLQPQISDLVVLDPNISTPSISSFDSLSVTDSIDIGQPPLSISDSLSVTDSIYTGQPPLSISDSLSVTDSITGMSQLHLTPSDSLTITDSITGMSQLYLTPSDSLTITDSITGMSQLHPSDSLSVTDSITGMSQLYLTPSDSLTITDSITGMSQLYLTPSDSLSITDTVTKMRHAPLLTSDSLSITDSITGMSQLHLTPSDSLTITDSITGMSQLYLTISDSLSITDSIYIGQPPLLTSDSLSITDAITGMSQYNITLSDSVDTFLSITDPSSASTILDEPGKSIVLRNSLDITTVVIGDNIYALVASNGDDGVQIINITDPTMLNATAAISKGDAFPPLDGAIGITTVVINNNIYALVASFFDDSVTIIDITNPADPLFTANLTDAGESTALDGAIDITTAVIGDNIYALVASLSDNGVQIINITDPTMPNATAAIFDNATLALGSARGITTVTIGTNTYALVASNGDNGVQIIDITDPTMPNATAAIFDREELALNNTSGITTVVIDDKTFALVASGADGVQIIDITNPASPSFPAAIFDREDLALNGAIGITTVTIGTKTFALVASTTDDSVTIIDITDPTNPTPLSTLIDRDTFPALDGAVSITTVTVGANTYALVASVIDNGVQIIDIGISLQPYTFDSTVLTPGISASDSISITDSITGMSQLYLTISDSLSVTDVITDMSQSQLITSDSLSITDTITDMSQHNISPSDSLSVTDSITDMRQLHLTISDSLSVTDVIIIGQHSLSLSDSLSVTDSITDMRQYNISTSDSLSVTDSITDMNQLHLTPSDSLSVTDSITDMSQQHLTFSDSLSVTDSINISQYSLSLSDSLSVTDSSISMRQYNISPSDSLSVTDSITDMNQLHLTPSDSLSVTDSITDMSQQHLTFSDSLSVTDSINISQYSLSLSDSLSVTDSSISMRQYNISPSDSLSVTDTITGMSQLHLTISDSLSVTDSIIGMSQLYLTISDSLSITDSITGMRQLELSDSPSITDTITDMRQYNISSSDSLSVTDSIIGMSQLHLTPSDSLSVTDILNLSKIQRVITITDITVPLPPSINYSASIVNVTLDYSMLLVTTTDTGQITTNEINAISSDIAGGDVTLTLQPSTTINGTNFNGIINLPQDLGVSCTVGFDDIAGTPVSCVDVGQTNLVLSLNSSAKIVLSDQAGNIPWYAQNRTASAVQITNVCDEDTLASANAQLSSNFDQCSIDVGNDLVIWTNHFTVYGSNAIVRSGGSSGESTPPSFTTSFDPGTSTISIGETDIAPEPFVIDHTLNDPVLVYTGESIPISLTMYENISWESIAHVEICLNKQISNNQICDSDTKIIWDKNADGLKIIDPNNIIRTASLDISETDSNVATWNYDITFDGIMNPSDMQIYAWDNKRNALAFTVENAINVVLGDTTGTATTGGTSGGSDGTSGGSDGTSGGSGSGGIISDTNNPPRTTSCDAGELLLNDGTCMDPEPGTFTCSDGEVMVYDGTCTAVTAKDNTIIDSDVSLDLDSQSDIIKRWAGYSELSATDYELTSSLDIETDSDVYLPKWIKSYLGELTIKNHITVDQLKSVVAYMAEISK